MTQGDVLKLYATQPKATQPKATQPTTADIMALQATPPKNIPFTAPTPEAAAKAKDEALKYGKNSLVPQIPAQVPPKGPDAESLAGQFGGKTADGIEFAMPEPEKEATDLGMPFAYKMPGGPDEVAYTGLDAFRTKQKIVPQDGTARAAGIAPSISGPVAQTETPGVYAEPRKQMEAVKSELRKPNWVDFLEAATAGWLGKQGRFVAQRDAEVAKAQEVAAKAQERIDQLDMLSQELAMRGKTEAAAQIEAEAADMRKLKAQQEFQAGQNALDRKAQEDPAQDPFAKYVSIMATAMAGGPVKKAGN